MGDKAGTILERGVLDLLDRNLVSLDPKTIERVQSKSDGAAWTLQKQGNEWKITESPAAPFTADAETENAVLNAWSKLQAVRVAAYGPMANLGQYGLDKPAITVTVTAQPADGKGAAVNHTLAIGKPVEGSPKERYARLDNGPGVVILPANAVAELTRPYLDFVNRTVLQVEADTITGLLRKQGEEELELAKRDDTWQLVKPQEKKADAETLDSLTKELSRLRARRVAAYPATDLKPFGLDEPQARWTLRCTGAKPVEHTLRLGKPADEASGERFAIVDDSTAVVVLPGPLSRRLTASALQFRDRSIARFADADRITLDRDRRQAVFAKVDGTWKLIEPVKADAEQAELEDFLNSMAKLRADELIADKPEDLKPFGLDKPEARWRLQYGDKEVLNLLVGNVDKEGTRRFAKLASGDVVFLLDPQLSTRSLAEYRSRTLWPPLDAVQVEKLAFGYPENPFTLEKVDNTWRVAGKPEVKVQPEAVQATLDALAGLKALRYVEDKSKELPLYGLEPPQLVLEIQTRTGKRLLHVGRPEGESKRHYARVPEGDRTDVFVIAENDAGRIVRNLAAFTQGK
jgi:hypothetical protein